jgi:uncharacterized membrane protein
MGNSYYIIMAISIGKKKTNTLVLKFTKVFLYQRVYQIINENWSEKVKQWELLALRGGMFLYHVRLQENYLKLNNKKKNQGKM